MVVKVGSAEIKVVGDEVWVRGGEFPGVGKWHAVAIVVGEDGADKVYVDGQEVVPNESTKAPEDK